MPFSGSVFLSQRQPLSLAGFGWPVPHCCWDWQAEDTERLPRRFFPCHSPPLPGPWGLGISAAASIAAFSVNPQSPLSMWHTRKSPAGEWKMQPIILICFLHVACFVDVCDCGADGLTFELFIHTSQPAQVGPHRQWGEELQVIHAIESTWQSTWELCPLKGNLVLSHTPRNCVSKGGESRF